MAEPRVWVCFPSADPAKAAIAKRKWQDQGYKVALFFDADRESIDSDLVLFGQYQGYWNATNQLASATFSKGADVVVFAADDIDPDPSKSATTIAAEYLVKYPDGFGVMQPCADPQGKDSSGRSAAARICGSPWFGKGWNDRAFGGRGPTDDRFKHFYSDELLYEVAKKLDLLWMRPDLMQFHRHWSFGHGRQSFYQRKNASNYWDSDKALFQQLKDEGYPGCFPLEMSGAKTTPDTL